MLSSDISIHFALLSVVYGRTTHDTPMAPCRLSL